MNKKIKFITKEVYEEHTIDYSFIYNGIVLKKEGLFILKTKEGVKVNLKLEKDEMVLENKGYKILLKKNLNIPSNIVFEDIYFKTYNELEKYILNDNTLEIHYIMYDENNVLLNKKIIYIEWEL